MADIESIRHRLADPMCGPNSFRVEDVAWLVARLAEVEALCDRDNPHLGHQGCLPVTEVRAAARGDADRPATQVAEWYRDNPMGYTPRGDGDQSAEHTCGEIARAGAVGVCDGCNQEGDRG